MSRGSWSDPALRSATLAGVRVRLAGSPPAGSPHPELYSDLLRLHVLPQLGGYPLTKVTPATVRAWHSETAQRTGATRTSQAYRPLHTLMGTAKSDGLVTDNPCQVKGAGQVRTPERPLLGLQDVFAVAEVIEPAFRPVVLLTYFAHLRIGEVLGLRRGDADLAAGTLRIERQVLRVGNVLTESVPKAESRRTVDLPVPALDALRQHLADRPALPSAPLFTLPSGGRLKHHHIRVAFHRALHELGMPSAHFHDLRHGGLTLAAQTGASLKEVMVRGGHSSPRAALIYQHNAQHRGVEIAAAMSLLAQAARERHTH